MSNKTTEMMEAERLAKHVSSYLEGISVRKLELLQGAMKQANSANCWWFTFDMMESRGIREFVQNELELRQRKPS